MIVRGVAVWGLTVGMFGCAAEDDGSTGESQGTEAATTAPTSSSSGGTTGGEEESGSSSSGGSSEDGESGGSSSSGSGSGSSGEGESGSDSGSGTSGELEYDPEFVWVADFLRANCVTCHPNNINGALVLPNAEITNEEVRIALDGVVANTGLLLVEPGDREASQTWLQITNEFGAIFPVEDTDRFGAWIEAGASYYVE